MLIFANVNLFCLPNYIICFTLISQGYVNELVEQNFTNHLDLVNREPILFGDYRNALTEDPRLYEDIVDYEAAKAVFDEVRVDLFSLLASVLDFFRLEYQPLFGKYTRAPSPKRRLDVWVCCC